LFGVGECGKRRVTGGHAGFIYRGLREEGEDDIEEVIEDVWRDARRFRSPTRSLTASSPTASLPP